MCRFSILQQATKKTIFLLEEWTGLCVDLLRPELCIWGKASLVMEHFEFIRVMNKIVFVFDDSGKNLRYLFARVVLLHDRINRIHEIERNKLGK